MNNEGCNGGVLVINDLSIHPKDRKGRVRIDLKYGTMTIEPECSDQAKRIVDNLSSQFDLEYAGVKDIYKMIEKWKDTSYNNRDFKNGYTTAMKDVKEYIEQRCTQVKER